MQTEKTEGEEEVNVIHAKFEHNSDKIKVTVADHMKEDKRSKKPNGKLLDLRE